MWQQFWTKTALLALAALALAPVTGADSAEPLPPEDAFRYSVSATSGQLTFDWDIEPGYYLYRPKISFKSLTDGVTLGAPDLPKGKEKIDEFFGKTEVYRDKARIAIPFTNSAGAGSMVLEVRSQGCADLGLCYPPQTWSSPVDIAMAGAAAAPINALAALGEAPDFLTGGQEFLHPDEAFQLIADMADDYTVKAYFNIAPGYYLYKDKFGFTGDSKLVQLGQPLLPKGKEKHDEFFGDVEVYYYNAEIRVPVSRASTAAGELELTASYQGCAEDGICYPPITKTTLVGISEASTTPPPDGPNRAGGPPAAKQDVFANLIANANIGWVLLSFFAAGLGLAFTPCVLPMVPILSGIIVGQGQSLTTRQSFNLSLVYVLAMALTYAAVGLVVALLGKNVQAIFQNAYVLIAFSLVFIALALAMFDVYELQMPSAIQSRLADMSNRQSGGNLLGVGVMGALSALIVGPCVAAPMVGALIFIGQSGDAVRGGLTLFALGLGMGAPLLAFGASAGKLMVKAGPWMTTVKQLFGILLLGVAVWLLARILPPRMTMFLWAALALGTGVVLGALTQAVGSARQVAKLLGLGVLAYGVVLGASTALGGFDPLNPLRGTRWHSEQHLAFERVKTVQDLDAAVAKASADGRPVMLDFYADWCVSCKEMEKYTFTDEAVRSSLGDALLLQADVTANDDDDQAMLKRFGVFGPPTIAFFAPGGAELSAYRVVGFMPAEQFSAHVGRALNER